MLRYCPNCGTEVDETAVFCPTCGQPIDQAAETELPPAPTWPDEPLGPPGEAPPSQADWGPTETAERAEPTRIVERPYEPEPGVPPSMPPPEPAAMGPPPDRAAPPRPQLNLPFTAPLTLSAWLIGGGALIGAIGALVGLFDGPFNPIELILLLALLGVAATVFLSEVTPEIPQLRLGTLVVLLIGFGVALDRLGFGSAGVGELLLFLGTAAAAIGAVILELGRDQPMGIAR